MVVDGKPCAVAAGEAVFVPTGAFHSTLNTGWEPLSLLAIYGPAGGEEALRGLPDYVEVAAGKTARPVGARAATGISPPRPHPFANPQINTTRLGHTRRMAP